MKKSLVKIFILILTLSTSLVVGCSGGNKFSGSKDVNTPVTPEPISPVVPEVDKNAKKESSTTCVSYIATKDTEENSQVSLEVYANGGSELSYKISFKNNYKKDSPRKVTGHSGTEYKIYKGTETVEDPKSGFVTSTKSIPATKLLSVKCPEEGDCYLLSTITTCNDELLYGGSENYGVIAKYTSIKDGKQSVYYTYAHRLYNSVTEFENTDLNQDQITSFDELRFDDFCFPIGHLDKIKYKSK